MQIQRPFFFIRTSRVLPSFGIFPKGASQPTPVNQRGWWKDVVLKQTYFTMIPTVCPEILPYIGHQFTRTDCLLYSTTSTQEKPCYPGNDKPV